MAIVAPESYFLGSPNCGYSTVHRFWVWIYPCLCGRQIKVRPLRHTMQIMADCDLASYVERERGGVVKTGFLVHFKNVIKV